MSTKKRAGGLWQARTTHKSINNLNQLTEKLNITKAELLEAFQSIEFKTLIGVLLQAEEKATDEDKAYFYTISKIGGTEFSNFIRQAIITTLGAWRKQGYIDENSDLKPIGKAQRATREKPEAVKDRPKGESQAKAEQQEAGEEPKPFNDKELTEILGLATKRENQAIKVRKKQTKAKIEKKEIDKDLGRLLMEAYDSQELKSANLQQIILKENEIIDSWKAKKQEAEQREKETANKKRLILEAYAKGEIDEAERDRQIGNLPF